MWPAYVSCSRYMSCESDKVVKSVVNPRGTDCQQSIENTLSLCHPATCITWRRHVITWRRHVAQIQQLLSNSCRRPPDWILYGHKAASSLLARRHRPTTVQVTDGRWRLFIHYSLISFETAVNKQAQKQLLGFAKRWIDCENNTLFANNTHYNFRQWHNAIPLMQTLPRPNCISSN